MRCVNEFATCTTAYRPKRFYVYWTKAFVLWKASSGGGFLHPREMGQAEVEGFLSMLATEKRVAPDTHRQALNALLFLYWQVLGIEVPWMQQIGRPPERKRIPVVLTTQELQAVLGLMVSTEALMAALLYGSGLRLREALGLRVKDVDFDRHAIVVRGGKGDKDRVVMLPKALIPLLQAQPAHARAVWGQDRASGHSGVFLPHALARKYPRAGESCRHPTFAEALSGSVSFKPRGTSCTSSHSHKGKGRCAPAWLPCAPARCAGRGSC
jgi:integrase